MSLETRQVEQQTEWGVYDLCCDYRENPLGLTTKRPLLSWKCRSALRGMQQKAYRIAAASSRKHLEKGMYDKWDSGIVSGSTSHHEYGGEVPRSTERIYWKVFVWDNEGRCAISKERAWWETGLLETEDWDGGWIGQGNRHIAGWSPLLRRSFRVEGAINRARIYMAGLGYAELRLNGAKVGDRLLDPAQTDYEERVFVTAYDVTKLLQVGENAVGVILGDGFYHQNRVWGGKMSYGEPCLLFQLLVDYEDGRQLRLGSDRSWKQLSGPITLNNVYAGETYDARLEREGWDMPGYDDADWVEAENVQGPEGSLEEHAMPPIRAVASLPPIAVNQPRAGVYVYDFSRNVAGWVKLRVKGPAGSEVTLRFAEELDASGMIDPNSGGGEHTHVLQCDKYILRGGDTEEWEPRFTYHGFRYVELTGFPGKPGPNTIQAIEVHTDLRESGEFNCSDPMLNRVHQVVKDTFVANFHGVPTDCPVREKCGWLGDAMIICDSVMYNWDSMLFWRKYVEDIVTTRKVRGIWTQVAPGKRTCGEAAPAWGTAQVEIPWRLYLHYGDERLLKLWYEDMRDWTMHLKNRSKEWIISFGIDDWWPPGSRQNPELPVPLISTSYFFQSVARMKEIAEELGFAEDAEQFRVMSEKIRQAFNRTFFISDEKAYGVQTANAFALYLGLVMPNKERLVAKVLAEDIVSRGYHLTTGHIGVKYVFEVLTDYGYGDVAQRVLNETTYPSFGHQLALGATTLWETWEGYKVLNGIRKGGSLNHPFKGGFDAWLFTHVLGIRPLEPGFRRIGIEPYRLGDLHYARGQYETPLGPVACEWEWFEGLFKLRLDIPANSCAEIRLPTLRLGEILESENSLANHPFVTVIGTAGGRTILTVGSGHYEFQFPYDEQCIEIRNN